jgi:hypothetical protein
LDASRALPSRPQAAPRVHPSPAGQAAAAALVALARAGRSVVLYDCGNAAVRQFIADYEEKTRSALEHGELCVEVRPFHMAVGGEVVYQDDDRERSLAFKLYRDGVRRLAIRPGVPWEELLRLLEVIAIRYAGVREQEEDILTLLRKAELSWISIDAVEGYTPAEESPEPKGGEKTLRTARAQPPSGWDTPLRPLPKPGPLAYRALPAELLAPLRAEADDLAELALSVARDLLEEAPRAGWASADTHLDAFFAELRDVLLSEGLLTSLKRLVDLVVAAGRGELRDAILRQLGDARTLDFVFASVPRDATELPSGFLPFLPLLDTEAALDRLAAEGSESRQKLLLGVLVARLPRHASTVLARLPQLPAPIGAELARAVVARAPERWFELARDLLGQADDALRIEGVAALEGAPGHVTPWPLFKLLHDRSRAVRVRAAEAIARRGDPSAADALRDALEAASDVGLDEAEALGRALARVAPTPAARLFAAWIDPPGRFLRGLSARQRVLQWAAVAGMGALPGGDAPAVLSALAQRARGELREHCLATLARRDEGNHARR